MIEWSDSEISEYPNSLSSSEDECLVKRTRVQNFVEDVVSQYSAKEFQSTFSGSLHDARLLRKSGIYEKICSNPEVVNGNFLISDSAYPNLSWLVTPFKDNGHLTHNEIRFNNDLSSTRVVVEHRQVEREVPKVA